MNFDFSEWATIVGGFSGLLSCLYVAYDKIKSGPKVVHEIISTSLIERTPSRTDQYYQYEFLIEVEIGNVGTELTTIIRASLELEELNEAYEINFPGDMPLDFGTKSIVLEPGFAKAYPIRLCIRNEKQLNHDFNGTLNMKLIGGKKILEKLTFSYVAP